MKVTSLPFPESHLHRLPQELADQLTEPFSKFLRVEAAASALLLFAAVIAVTISNSKWANTVEQLWESNIGFHIASFSFTRSLREWINDGAMTLFFFLVALELKRAIVLGELRHPRIAALSVAGALGGMIVPAMLYLLLQWGQPSSSGWGTVMATDTAFVIGALALLGSRIPHGLRLFILALAIVDDIGAILVVAIGYSGRISWAALALAALGVVFVRVLALLGIRSVAIYFMAGVLIWFAVDASGVHATVTGVLLGLLTPARRWVSDDRLYTILSRVIAHPTIEESGGPTKDRDTLQLAARAARETLSPAERLELILHPWVGFLIMPVFALANAGLSVSFSDLQHSVTIAVVVGFVVGKPLGVVTFCWLAVRSGIAKRTPDLSWSLLAGSAMLAGIGFTMALFIASLAFPPSVLGTVKLGIFVGSGLSALFGLVVLTWSARSVGHPRPTR